MSRKALGRGLNALFTQSAPLDHDLMDLDIDRIDPAVDQPRSIFKQDKLEELAQSIRHNGIIQPLVVRRNGERFQLIAGERRWRAAQKAGLHKVPCIVKEVSDENVLELSLIENIQREELNPIEEANAYRKLLEKQNLTQEEIAKRVGKDRTSITNSLRLLKLPLEIQKMVEDEELSMGHARAILAVESAEQQIGYAKEIIDNGLSVRDTEQLVKKGPGSGSRSARSKSEGSQVVDANVMAAEAKLSRKLSAPVKIKLGKSGGAIEIRFSSADDLTRLFDTLMQSHLHAHQ
jgi:ParB family transcriptional regulator, chromosome partitioning protein